jgi:hypothetical protein
MARIIFTFIFFINGFIYSSAVFPEPTRQKTYPIIKEGIAEHGRISSGRGGCVWNWSIDKHGSDYCNITIKERFRCGETQFWRRSFGYTSWTSNLQQLDPYSVTTGIAGFTAGEITITAKCKNGKECARFIISKQYATNPENKKGEGSNKEERSSRIKIDLNSASAGKKVADALSALINMCQNI